MTFEEDLSSRYWAYRYLLDKYRRDRYVEAMTAYLDFLKLSATQRNSILRLYDKDYRDFRKTIMRLKPGGENVVIDLMFYWLRQQNHVRDVLTLEQLLTYRRATSRPLEFDLPGLFPFFYWSDDTLVLYSEKFYDDLNGHSKGYME